MKWGCDVQKELKIFLEEFDFKLGYGIKYRENWVE